MHRREGFTLIELILVIVIVGILSTLVIPRFGDLIDNSRVASELSTASSVQSAIDATHGEWITNACTFTWGNEVNSSLLNSYGYPEPETMGDAVNPFKNLLKNAETGEWTRDDSYAPCRYYGPATNDKTRHTNLPNKPEGDDYWEYNSTTGVFKLVEP